jgi:hypothetical protein
MGARRVWWVAVACAFACDRPIHPNDPEIPDKLCEPRCAREHDCDAKIEVASCVSHCEHQLSPRKVYYREDLVASLRACAQGQSCGGDVDARIDACEADVRKRLEPSAESGNYCRRFVERSFKCGDYRWDEDHCLYGTKVYTDAILGQLTDCLDQPCRQYGECGVAVVGWDPIVADRDRMAEYHRTPVPKTRNDSVAVEGAVTREGQVPLAGATVCAGPDRCATTSDSGAYSLILPAHGELAISVSAAGFGKRLVALATVGQDVKPFDIVLQAKAVLEARATAAGATYPDDATGVIFATARAPNGASIGLEGVTMAIQPASGRGPLYFTATSDPDPGRTSTSTWSSGLFAAVKPGEVTLTFGPPFVTCVPLYGGWPSGPNSVRVPVAAGFETRTVMRCHR